MNREHGYKRKKRGHALIWLIVLEVMVVLGAIAFLLFTMQRDKIFQREPESEERATLPYVETETEEIKTTFVPSPEIREELLTINEWSRPGKKIKSLNYIVIHYLGNPETTADQNHHYFESLKDLQNNYMSANYIVGMEGEIIHCVPDDEVAWASNNANSYSISIENCHPDESGKLTDDTYSSLVKLVAYLSEKYNLDRAHIIRHYDVTGKICPKWFVEHPQDWEDFLDEVMDYRDECRKEYETNWNRRKRTRQMTMMTSWRSSFRTMRRRANHKIYGKKLL